METQTEGYWTTECMPVPNQLTVVEAQEIFELIKAKEQEAIDDPNSGFMGENPVQYRGFSTSMIDGTIVGSAEFEHGGWTWPAGFAEHYVLLHKVKPTDEFIEFLKSVIDESK